MLGARSLIVALSLLTAIPAVEARPARSRPAPSAKAARKRPAAHQAAVKPAAKAAAKPAVRARATERIQPRRPVLDLGGAAEVGHNTAPPAENDLERRLQEQLDGIVGGPRLKSAINGIYVVDTASGKVLYAYGADRQLNPASNTKLISTATALDLLGGDFTYVTRMVGPQPDADGVVPGDVLLLGSGDPTLRIDHLRELAAALKERGVKKIAGRVVIGSDDSDAVAAPWVRVGVRGGGAPGELPAVRIAPDSGFFLVDNRATTSAAARKRKKNANRISVTAALIDTQAGPRLKITVSGKITARGYVEAVRRVPRPTLYTAHTLRAFLLDAGIEVAGVDQRGERPEPAIGSVELARHDSVPLRTLTAMINKPSDNYLADRLIMTVGAEKFGGDRNMQKGVEAMNEWLENIGVSGSFRLENGSGLSHTIHISARQIAQVLMAGTRDDRFGQEWLDSFAVGGEDGTLRHRFAGRPAAGFVRGKTGTLSGVAALSGFVTLTADDKVCFAILTSGFRARRINGIREAQTEMVDAIYAYLHDRMGDHAPPAPPVEPDL